MSSTNENINPQVLKKVAKELYKLSETPIEGVQIHMNEEDLTDIQATITGPACTPYEGGQFRMKLVLSGDFPQAPPKGFFITKIFHPNVSSSGDICVNTLKRDWKAEYGLSHILTVVKCLLIQPNAESALNEEAGMLLLEQFDEFAKRAKMMTEIHAKQSSKTMDKSQIDAGKKRTAVKKKTDKKRALKRL